jgi:hypothetical protein
MSDLSIQLHWRRTEPELQPGKYSSEHTVQFNGNHEFQADSAPDWGGDANNTNPEQALASALSNCHMMTFLALVRRVKSPQRALANKLWQHRKVGWLWLCARSCQHCVDLTSVVGLVIEEFSRAERRWSFHPR